MFKELIIWSIPSHKILIKKGCNICSSTQCIRTMMCCPDISGTVVTSINYNSDSQPKVYFCSPQRVINRLNRKNGNYDMVKKIYAHILVFRWKINKYKCDTNWVQILGCHGTHCGSCCTLWEKVKKKIDTESFCRHRLSLCLVWKMIVTISTKGGYCYK